MKQTPGQLKLQIFSHSILISFLCFHKILLHQWRINCDSRDETMGIHRNQCIELGSISCQIRPEKKSVSKCFSFCWSLSTQHFKKGQVYIYMYISRNIPLKILSLHLKGIKNTKWLLEKETHQWCHCPCFPGWRLGWWQPHSCSPWQLHLNWLVGA